MNNKPKRTISSYILIVGIMTLTIVGSIVAFTVYKGLTKSQISQRQSLNITPLDGVIEKVAVENLTSRRSFTEAEFNKLVFNSISEVSIASASSPSGQTQ